MGWATVAAYFAAAILATLAARRATGRQRAFWIGLAVILLALTVNKQLDLQSALTEAGRCISKAQGWYEARRSVQVIFIKAVLVASALAAACLTWAMRRDLGNVWLAVAGFVLLIAFVAVRAVGFHHVDHLIGYELGSVRMNWLLEIGGIAMIAANALATGRMRPVRRGAAR